MIEHCHFIIWEVWQSQSYSSLLKMNIYQYLNIYNYLSEKLIWNNILKKVKYYTYCWLVYPMDLPFKGDLCLPVSLRGMCQAMCGGESEPLPELLSTFSIFLESTHLLFLTPVIHWAYMMPGNTFVRYFQSNGCQRSRGKRKQEIQAKTQ